MSKLPLIFFLITVFIINDSYSQKSRTSNFTNDSLHTIVLKKQISKAYKAKEWELFGKLQKEQLQLTNSLKDTLGNALCLEYYGAYYSSVQLKPDSAYYYYTRAFNSYIDLNKQRKAGSMLLNKAILQKNVKDFAGSTVNSFNALKYFDDQKDVKKIASVYNNLGLIYDNQNDFEESINYHKKALILRNQINDKPLLRVGSLNNIGKAYRNDKNYKDAKFHFEQALQYDSILKTNRRLRATIIDNYAFTMYKDNSDSSVVNMLSDALAERQSIDHKDGIIISSIHLAEYHRDYNNSDSALYYANQAEKLARQTNNYRDYLESIVLLSSLHTGKEAQKHFSKYISLRDSLDALSIKHRDQFARIEFDVKKKDHQLDEQATKLKQNQYLILVVISLILIATITMLVLRTRRVLQRKRIEQLFEVYLTKKYKLHHENLQLWKLLVQGLTQEEIAEIIFRSTDTVKTRRKALYKKIRTVNKGVINLDKSKVVLLFKEEQEFHTNVVGSDEHD